jgi:hypothetical protein
VDFALLVQPTHCCVRPEIISGMPQVLLNRGRWWREAARICVTGVMSEVENLDDLSTRNPLDTSTARN